MQEVATFPPPQRFWGILTALPGSQTGLARCAWGGTSSTNRTLLAAGKMGRGREWGSRASHTVVPWVLLRTRRKRKLLFLWESGYRWPLDQQRNRNKTKQRILLPALRRGNEWRCSRRLLRKSKLLNLRVARVRAASSTFWTTWGLAGMRGRCSRRAGLGVNSAWGGAALEDAGGRPWRRADWNQWTTYNMILLQLEQTTGLSGRRGTGPPTEPGFSQGFFSILSPMEFWFLATDTSFPAISSTSLHRYYLNWTELDDAITKFNNEMPSAEYWVLNLDILRYWHNFPILILCSCFVTICIVKSAI